jgi:hypothetical protein
MDDRKLIYMNILNGVQISTLSRVFHVPDADIKRDFDFITQKIKLYCYKNAMPPIKCDTLESAQQNRLDILPILDVINLEIQPDLKIVTEHLTPEFTERFAR